MKRFLAFSYDSYYPCGGQGDFSGDFDTESMALQAVEQTHDYLDILDTASGTWTYFKLTRSDDNSINWQPQPLSGFAT